MRGGGKKAGLVPVKGKPDASVAPVEATNFIRNIIKQDLSSGKHASIVTRFPPEPNGYLHIGHAKSICVNFGLGQEFGGATYMRLDDTNPAKEEQEYVDSILADVKWLGFDWGERLTHASDYFPQFHALAVELIKEGKAYVDESSVEELRRMRGSLTQPGENSPFRERSVADNLRLFEQMTAGELPDGAAVVRLKIDMAAGNMNLRDPPIYRIKRDADHPMTGTLWNVYPMYDYAHALTDAIEGVTHSLCTLEFENHRELYDWVVRECTVPCTPRQIEFSRLNLQYTVLSKRRLIQLVETPGIVNGWDDPRMPTISGLRRRGVPPAAIKLFVERTGVSKADNNIDYTVLEECVRESLDPQVPRAMAVLDPLKVTITNWPEGEVDQLEVPIHPKRPEMGTRILPFDGTLYIERDDYSEEPPPKYFRLRPPTDEAPAPQVRLRFGYVISLHEVVRDADGRVTELKCTYDPETRAGAGAKVKGIIHWVSAAHALPARVRLYDRLFVTPSPGAGHADGDFLKDLNPDSLQELAGAVVEPSLASAALGDTYQFERTGYFAVDPDASEGDLVLNRVVTLRDTWAAKAAAPPPVEVAEVVALLPEEVAAVEAQADAQAKEVRRLKDEGLGNKSPEVAAAVAELLRIKALLPES